MRTKKTRARKRKTIRLWVGWDGSYVVSKFKLRKFSDLSCEYLATGRRFSCVDIHEDDGKKLFGHLGLKMFEVVRIEIGVMP